MKLIPLSIRKNCKYPGYFATAEKASEAYENAAKEAFGEFYREKLS